MQYDRLELDQASVIHNREVSLIRRSSKYMFLWLTGTVDGRPYNGGVLNSEVRNRKVPLYILFSFLHDTILNESLQ